MMDVDQSIFCDELIRKTEFYHNLAMEICYELDAIKDDESKEYREKAIMAYDAERHAADLVAMITIEPTRSILLRSAATLALDCHKFDEAERLIDLGLQGNVPHPIVEELNELRDQLKTRRDINKAFRLTILE